MLYMPSANDRKMSRKLRAILFERWGSPPSLLKPGQRRGGNARTRTSLLHKLHTITLRNLHLLCAAAEGAAASSLQTPLPTHQELSNGGSPTAYPLRAKTGHNRLLNRGSKGSEGSETVPSRAFAPFVNPCRSLAREVHSIAALLDGGSPSLPPFALPYAFRSSKSSAIHEVVCPS